MIGIMMAPLTTLLGRLGGRDVRFAAGEAVFLRGDPVRWLHVVQAGTIHLVRYQPGGEALILQRAAAPAILAEASVYSASYHCDGRAETEAATRAIPIGEVRRRVAEDPEAAEAWGRHLAQEVQRARLHAEILAMRTVRSRLDAWLAWHGGLPEKGRWLAVAREIGVTPEALYREIARRGRLTSPARGRGGA